MTQVLATGFTRQVLAGLALALFGFGPAIASEIQALEFLGEAIISPATSVSDAPVGGLSGLTYDTERGLFYSVSDDPGSRGPARFYTLDIDLTEDKLASGAATVRGVTELFDLDGSPFPEPEIDAEGIALTTSRTLLISSEGQANRQIEPFVREFSLAGQPIRSFSIPRKYRPHARKPKGVRHNLVFESVTTDPAGKWVFSSIENALQQDGPPADVGSGSPARILRFAATSARTVAEYVYPVEPVPEAPPDPEAFRTNGLVDLIALGPSRLLALERAYSAGVGNRFRIFVVELEQATNVRRFRRLGRRSYRPVRKHLLLDSISLDRPVDNIEGMTFGPALSDGRRTLVLVSDDNFNDRQKTQVLAFAVAEGEGEGDFLAGDIQGRNHSSSYVGSWVRGLVGVVTAWAGSGPGFWLQTNPDSDPATSDALLVVPEDAGQKPEPGATVSVAGLIEEQGFSGALEVTTVAHATVTSSIGRAALPKPVVLGLTGRTVPDQHVDDDGLAIFQPADDTIDFFESLEGMRVALPDAVAIGPTTRFGEFAVLVDRGQGSAPRSRAGGVVVTSDEIHPERLLVSSRGLGQEQAPPITVGDRFEAPLVGVLEYAFGSFRLLAESMPDVVSGGLVAERTDLGLARESLSIASYNVENLSARSGADKFQRVADTIVNNLAAPDILALQEIQDDSGPANDGTVSAALTLDTLVTAIADAGGPRYDFAQVDPVDASDGGRPGANIRVAYLYRSDRVGLVRRGRADSSTSAEWLTDVRGPFLSPNPARIAPSHPAFRAEGQVSGSRKPLAIEFEFAGRRVFLVNVHFRSKRGDLPLFGATQPPTRPTETLRAAEAQVVRSFGDELFELDPAAAFVILGDFNEHPYREPISILAGHDLQNLIERIEVPDRYTFIFRGNSQVLDNVLVSPSLASEDRAEVQIVHCNADRPDGLRAADHEPVLVVLDFSSPRPPQDDS